MSGNLAGIRYAKSLMSLATEKNVLDDVYRDMEVVASTVKENRDLELLLKSPIIKTDKKQSVLNDIFGSKTSELSKMFLTLISNRKREGIIGDIASAFIDLYKRSKNIIVAEVTSAVQLDAAQKEKIINLITGNNSASVEVVEKINPDIIGGFVVRVDDKQIDASILRELNDLKQEFSKNPYIAEF